MKFFKLITTPSATPSFLPGDTIQNFDSLVWTERYSTAGEFQMILEKDVSLLTALPTGSLVSHTDTKEVMIVENQEVERPKKGNLKVTISGRSLETFAENRPTAGSLLPISPNTNIETSAVASSATIAASLLKGQLEPGTASVGNAIPNLRIVTTMRVLDTAMAQVIQRGDVYARVLELLKLANGGIKMVRPLGAQTTLDLVVHDGIDRTQSVVFYALREDLEDCKYFWSIKGSKNFAQIATDISTRLYKSRDVPGLDTDVVGLNRRVVYVEAGDLKLAYSPATSTDVVAARGQLELDADIQVYLMEATVTETARPKFKIHYDVGDLVTVFGGFQPAQTMRVLEHTLTFDKDGQRGFPALGAP
jgi:Siphovirus ReqiPepy6 Gp37-like protein